MLQKMLSLLIIAQLLVLSSSSTTISSSSPSWEVSIASSSYFHGNADRYFHSVASVVLAANMPESTFTLSELFNFGTMATFVVLIPFALFGFVGTMFGIWAWFAIARSQGQLRGLWLAVTSVFPLPTAAILLLLDLLLFAR